jgi:hypothetical protein
MASVHKDIAVRAAAGDVWDALRDYGAVHERVAADFVVDAHLEGTDRVVTFVGGAQARERLVTLDDQRRRLVYTVVEGPLGATHHQASVEVVDDGDESCTVRWTTDVLPDDLAVAIDGLMDRGAAAMASTLRRT